MPELIDRTYAVTDFEIQRTDRAGRTVTAYAAVFDQEAEIRDAYGHYYESINRTSFNRAISHGIHRVNVFYNHGYDLTGKPNMLGAVPIATPLEIKPDGTGLLTVSRYNDGELADAILAAWDGGQITGQSFRGTVYNSRPKGSRGGVKAIERTELGLKEYGPTHSPAYAGAGLVAIRSQDELAELVRSMISEMVGTSPSPSTENRGTSPEPAAAGDSPIGHSSRKAEARHIAMRARALSLGAISGQAPHQYRDRD